MHVTHGDVRKCIAGDHAESPFDDLKVVCWVVEACYRLEPEGETWRLYSSPKHRWSKERAIRCAATVQTGCPRKLRTRVWPGCTYCGKSANAACNFHGEAVCIPCYAKQTIARADVGQGTR